MQNQIFKLSTVEDIELFSRNKHTLQNTANKKKINWNLLRSYWFYTYLYTAFLRTIEGVQS